MDRRRQSRNRTFKAGKIVFNHRRSVIDCMVRNLSPIGACLHVASAFGVPDRFEIVLADGQSHGCRAIWRTATQIGVEFEDQAAERHQAA